MRNNKILEMHTDGSFINKYTLNNENEFEGGGTAFEDGLVMNANKVI